MQVKNGYFFFFGALFYSCLCLTSCSTAKFLGPDEYLLKGNSLTFKKPYKSLKNKPALKYKLSEYYRQTANRKFFGIPREWFYFKTQDPNDTTKFDQWIRRTIAEPPAIFDDTLRIETEKALRDYLKNKGYYNVEVYSSLRYKGSKKVLVDYFVKPADQFIVDTTEFNSPDPKVVAELNKISPATHLKKGEALDFITFEKERDRITNHLKNNGYAYFFPYSIATLEADTTINPPNANLYLTVDAPPNDSVHRIYYVGKIDVFTDFSPLKRTTELYDTLVQGYTFYNSTSSFELKPNLISDAIQLNAGDLYNQEAYDKTYQKLSGLGVYKFIRIRQEVDSLQTDQINFRIELTPAQRMELSLDFELNYTNRNANSSLTPNLFGMSLSPGFSHKNLLGGAEFSVTNLSAGIEFNPASNTPRARIWNTVDFGITTELTLPRFLDYFGIWKLTESLTRGKAYKSSKNSLYSFFEQNASTKFSAGYNYILLLDLYRYNLFNASFGYDIRKSNTNRYRISHFGVDYLEPFVQPAFQAILDNNLFLERSFGQQLFVSLLFREFNYIFNSRRKANGESNYFSFRVETAGSEIWALNQLTNLINNSQDTFRIGNTKFSQYISLETDWRFYKEITPKRGFAFRMYAGLVRPFGFTSDVPFVKQYAAGGPNSIRGWVERGLGPGGYLDTLAHDPENRFRLDPENRLRLYQTGDLKLEFNAEYRFNLYWLLDGALFLDAGNIWTIKSDPDRCGSQFLFSARTTEGCEEEAVLNDPFYRQIALGTGFGLRLDLTYFILRLDMGVRLRYPFPLEFPRSDRVSEGAYWADFRGWGINDVNFNLGFGYPF